ncbi:MAG: DPP IV N-terminal domain-containing protein [Anaerolineae bacterium]
MLARTYRLTDKTGVVFIKTCLLALDWVLDGLLFVERRLLRPVLRPFVRGIVALVALVWGLIGGGARKATQASATTTRTAMARRTARAEMAAAVPEDPLRRQNRALSLMTLLLLAVLIAVVVWATNPRSAAPLPVTGGSSAAIAATAAPGQNEPTPLPAALATGVPTATQLPEALEVQGSLAYVVRENGQSDLWAAPVGGQSPIRITNSPADERDPVWSPDGRQLAFASHQDGNWELYLYDVESGETTRLTYDLSFQGGPAWSPDGQWLVYENYQGDDLDVYILRLNSGEAPIRLPGNSDAPDFSPAWSPDGRRIAFASWRDGNQDIYVFSLDDQSVVNVTNTPGRNEDFPVWHPDPEQDLLAYSALDGGFDKVFVQSASNPASPAQAVALGTRPAWSPDGNSLLYSADSAGGTQLIAVPFGNATGFAPVIAVPAGTRDPSWTASPLPASLVNSGGLPPASTEPLYDEQVTVRPSDPPYALTNIGANVENAVLSDRVNDSFNALRQAALDSVGYDILGRLDAAFWPLDRPPEPGVERRNWHLAGRAFAIPRGLISGFPAPLEIVREDVGVDTEWRVFARAADDAQDGQLGEPLREMPWDFASRTQGDVEAYDQGGRLRADMPSGYYVDLTRLAQDYGWDRLPAGTDWRANANSINFWEFIKTSGLDWYSAMREIYAEGPLVNFAPTAVPPVGGSAPATAAPTLAAPTQAATLSAEQLLTPSGSP